MLKKCGIVIISAAVIAIVIMFAGLFIFQKFMNHELGQSDRISVLEARLRLIEEKAELSEGSMHKFGGGGV